MKVLLLLTALLVTAGLFSYTYKGNVVTTVEKPEDIMRCYPDDIREISRLEAATKEFADLHPDPLYMEFKPGKGSSISFPTPDGQTAAGYEIKSDKKSRNYLFVIHEWYGLNDYIKREAERLSTEVDNVNVIALDLYDGKVASTADSAMKYMSGASTPRLENIIRGAIGYAGNDANIFTIGWCFGGMWSLQASILAGRQGRGCVMYYGRPETNVAKLQQLNTDVIGFFGNLDKSIPPEKVTEFENNMKTAGKGIKVYRYDAAHGFANPSNPVYDKQAGDDAHEKTIAYLKARIK